MDSAVFDMCSADIMHLIGCPNPWLFESWNLAESRTACSTEWTLLLALWQAVVMWLMRSVGGVLDMNCCISPAVTKCVADGRLTRTLSIRLLLLTFCFVGRLMLSMCPVLRLRIV